MDFLYGAAGGGVVGLIAVAFGAFAFAYIKRLITERDNLAERRMNTLENKLDEHVKQDRSGEIWSELRNMGGNIEKLLSQTTALLVGNETQRQQIITLFKNQDDIKTEFKECRREHK